MKKTPFAVRAGLVADVHLNLRGHTIELYEIQLDPADGDDEMLDQALAAAARTRLPSDCPHTWEHHGHVIARRRGYSTSLDNWVTHGDGVAAPVCVSCSRPPSTSATPAPVWSARQSSTWIA